MGMLGAHGVERVANWPMWEAWGWGKGGGEKGPGGKMSPFSGSSQPVGLAAPSPLTVQWLG